MCRVVFENGYRSYDYFTDNSSIKIGDAVVVPAEKDNVEKTVTVVEIERVNPLTCDNNIDLLKFVISKCE